MKRRLLAYLLCLLLLLQCIQGQLLYPTKTTTASQRLVARDDDHRNDEKPSSDRKSSEDGSKDKKNAAAPRVTTEINIIYTTIIYTSASSTAVSTLPAAATASLPPLPNVYNVSNTGSAHQEQDPQSASSTNLDDPNNKKDDLAENLRDDQQALKRMIMILSLVGGLGVIAVVATIVIFTRMRVKNRKQREIDEEGNEGSTFELSHDVDRQSSVSNTSDSRGGGGQEGALLGSTSSITSASSAASSQANGRALTEPSAPPALMMIEGLQEPLHRSRRNVISMSSQTTAPSPSAPTAKELDAMDEDSSSSTAATTSTPYNHHILHHHHQQEQINSCSRCTPMMMAPELPPPAYTPSAPPHYALPIEANVIEPSTTSMSASSSMSPLPSRRHSLGG
ncbi:hypothetical protein V8B55DRAFT_1541255 [Mucor lusitanicus]|uniref:Mid2 domain-containing protein n=1 Tax=Mucor circinelloides f. lusitanicus TaxID=29924 RepID=A0A8H4EYY7_MUCCL|nr:hypothetical protein FB192DRAFT_1388326 [Mucor lusitanicus]